MKNKVLFSGLGLICLLATIGVVRHASKTETPAVLPQQNKSEMAVLVKFKAGIISPSTLRHSTTELPNQQLQSIFEANGITSMMCVFQNRYGKDGKLKSTPARQNFNQLESWQKIMMPSLEEATAFLQIAKNLPDVEYAQLDERFEFKPAISPDDPSYLLGQQWHLNSTNNPTADIDAPEAWDINRGRNDVTIAILDGGVDYNHRDLDPGNRSRVIAGIDTGSGDNDPLDDLPYNDPKSYAGHGTSVAGIVGAITNNNNLVAGVMWNCKIMPVKMVGGGNFSIKYPFGSIDVNFATTALPGDVANAIDYAVNNGAQVINLSYGFHRIGFPIDQVILQVPLLYQTLNNAYLNNVVTCASMGNEFLTDNSPSYPAGFSEQVIPVGGSDNQRARVNTSNTGSHISVVAPGIGIVTAARGGGVNTSFTGTSAASPIVAGVAGLIISQGKDRNFNLTNNDVKRIIELTAVDAGVVIGFDNDTGYGIVNANNALRLLAPPNVLYHYTSTGGTSTKIATISRWILLDNRWGLAAATYFGVDQYKITKRVTFDVPFCAPPKVWMRERESKSLDYSNPNLARPRAFITNVTATGFDLEYVTYFVKNSTTGAEINKWVPAPPTSSVVAYTVVGQPNPASLVTMSGPSPVCSSATFLANNNSNNLPVTWSSSNPSGLSINPATGVATRQNNYNGPATITAVINGSCGSVVLAYPVIVGKGTSENQFTILGSNYCRSLTLMFNGYVGIVPGATNYQWFVKTGSGSYLATPFNGPTQYSIDRAISRTQPQYFKVIVTTPCGNLEAEDGPYQAFVGDCSGVGGVLRVFPNPSSAQLTLDFETPSDINLAAQEQTEQSVAADFEAQLYFPFGNLATMGKSKNSKITLDVSTLPDGLYVLKVNKQGEVFTRQISIKH